MKSKRISLKSNLDIHYYESGDPAGPPLVLLHGWPSSGLLWREIIPALAGRFRVLAPDLPGHGQSDKPPHLVYDLECLRNFVLDFLDALGLDTVHLVAHDLGDMAALSLAVRNPERIDKLEVMNTSPYPKWRWQLSLVINLLKTLALTPLFLNPFVFKQVLASVGYTTLLCSPRNWWSCSGSRGPGKRKTGLPFPGPLPCRRSRWWNQGRSCNRWTCPAWSSGGNGTDSSLSELPGSSIKTSRDQNSLVLTVPAISFRRRNRKTLQKNCWISSDSVLF